MILPLLFSLTLLRFPSVYSTSNKFPIFAYSIRGENHVKHHYSLHNLLGTLTSPIENNGFSNTTTIFPKTPYQLHGLYLCRGDVDPQGCQSCLNSAKNFILKEYPNGKGGLIWYDHCMLRYSNASFLGTLDVDMWYVLGDNSKVKGNNVKFMRILSNTMKGLAIEASKGQKDGNKFSSKVVKFTRFESLYVMVQCTPDLSNSACFKCLRNANEKLLNLFGSTSAKALSHSCMAEYKTTFAFDDHKFRYLPFSPSAKVTNVTLIRMRVQLEPIPFSHISDPSRAITNSTRIRFKVRFETSLLSNGTVSTSMSLSSYEISNSTVIRLEAVKGKLDIDADRNQRSKEWLAA